MRMATKYSSRTFGKGLPLVAALALAVLSLLAMVYVYKTTLGRGPNLVTEEGSKSGTGKGAPTGGGGMGPPSDSPQRKLMQKGIDEWMEREGFTKKAKGGAAKADQKKSPPKTK